MLHCLSGHGHLGNEEALQLGVPVRHVRYSNRNDITIALHFMDHSIGVGQARLVLHGG